MQDNTLLLSVKKILENLPLSWIHLTTHRLDIYDEKLAKTQFLQELEILIRANTIETSALNKLPTAYDYIRLGHPLSCVLEWGIANLHQLNPEYVISFSSQTIPILAILRKNLISNTKTLIAYTGSFPPLLDLTLLKSVYGYDFDLKKIEHLEELSEFDGSTLYFSQQKDLSKITISKNIDYYVTANAQLGSLLIINGEQNASSISDIQHVRRRETIAMTPANCLIALKQLVGQFVSETTKTAIEVNKTQVLNSIKTITGTTTTPVVGSSGLSVQYAIMMGLVHHAYENHPGKAIQFIVPPNCYGGYQ